MRKVGPSLPLLCVLWGPGGWQELAFLPAFMQHLYQWVTTVRIHQLQPRDTNTLGSLGRIDAVMHIYNPINGKAEVGSLRSAWDILQDPSQLELTGKREKKTGGRQGWRVGVEEERDLKTQKERMEKLIKIEMTLTLDKSKIICQ